MDSTQFTGTGAVVVVSGAGRRASLPVDVVADIAAAGPALKLPFAADGLEGAVPCGDVLTAQVDLAHAWGGAAKAGGYALLVRTSRGPVRVRVEGVAGPLPSFASADAACALADIEALLAGYLGRGPDTTPSPSRLSPGLAVPGLVVMVLQAGGERIALPAADVEAVVRVQAAWRPRGGGADERIVAFEGGLLPGCALADWLGVPSTGPSGWAVVVQAGARRLAIIAEHVHMPPRVPAASVEVVQLRHGHAIWLADAAGTRLQLVPPAAFAAPHAISTGPMPPLAVMPCPPRMVAPRTGGGVAMRAGPFSCVLPQEVVCGVHAGLRPGPVRGPDAVPVFDLCALLGLTTPGVASPALVVLHRPGRRQVALMADAVTLAAPASDWAAPPPAPAALHILFDAARPLAGGCQLRLRPAALARRGGCVPPGLVRAAFRGWTHVAGGALAGASECSRT